MNRISRRPGLIAVISVALTAFSFIPARGALILNPDQFVQAGGIDIEVPGYSVPSLAEWNGDTLPDLIVGEGGLGLFTGKVRVYINQGSPGAPEFNSFSYIQADGADLERTSGG